MKEWKLNFFVVYSALGSIAVADWAEILSCKNDNNEPEMTARIHSKYASSLQGFAMTDDATDSDFKVVIFKETDLTMTVTDDSKF